MSDDIARTCRFFDPNQTEATEAGLISGPLYPFNRHYGFASCLCPAQGYLEPNVVMCPFGANPALDMSRCETYEPEPTQRLRLSRVEHRDEGAPIVDDWVLLDLTRLGRGVGEYRVITWTAPAETEPRIPADAQIVHRVYSHPDPDAAAVIAEEYFTQTVTGAQRLDSEAVVSVPTEEIAAPAHGLVALVTSD